MSTITFPCAQCGAKLEYAPGTTELACPHCGHATPIQQADVPVPELDYRTHLASAAHEAAVEATIVTCKACGGQSRLPANVVADRCPFCGSSVINTVSRRLISPQALVPFAITRQQALVIFQQWVHTLWFAPSEMKRLANAESGRLQGTYLPYWTFDADTRSYYTGARGEHYSETEHYIATENGRTVTRTRQVQRTRWYDTAGTVWNRFNDVLVLAIRTLRPRLYDILEPWDLQHLTPYTEEYLSGFRAVSYHIDLVDGFTAAKDGIDTAICQSINHDIGGDTQRIDSVDTAYTSLTFKHILLPVWLCSYRYREKVYTFLVNGQTGDMAGERPWSWEKIILLVLAILALLIAIGYAIAYLNAGNAPQP